MSTKVKVYKNNCVEDLISYEDYLKATGLEDDVVYPIMLEGPWEKESDGDFIYRIDLTEYKHSIMNLRECLPIDVIERNRFGVEYCQ